MKKKSNWKVKTKEERQQELTELIEDSNKQIEKYKKKPEDLLEYMNFMAKIHNYSPLNLSLIDRQFEGAVAVASYARWKELGFTVQKGEKGIGVYVHAPVTIFKDKDGEEKTLREATVQEKELIKKGEIESRKIQHYKKGYVFDISQTDAKPEDLPKIFPNRVWNFDIKGENSIEELEKGIKSIADSLNIEIKDMRSTNIKELGAARGAYAQYLNGNEEIALNSRNTRSQNIATSIHELAHRRLHKKTEAGATYDTCIKEFQAEMTSYVVCKNYGMDTSEKAIPYIAGWTKNNTKIEPKEFRSIMKGVQETALEFIEKIDKTILEERQKEPTIQAQKNSFNNEEDLQSIALKEAEEKLSINYREAELIDEINNQSRITSIEQLTSCNNVEKFYDKHKQEIEANIDEMERTTGCDIRKVPGEKYKERMATLAYRKTASELNSKIDNGEIKIPNRKEYRQEIEIG